MNKRQSIAKLQHWLEETPSYQGGDPRSVHYERNRAALTMAIESLQDRKTPLPEELEQEIWRKVRLSNSQDGSKYRTSPEFAAGVEVMVDVIIGVVRSFNTTERPEPKEWR